MLPCVPVQFFLEQDVLGRLVAVHHGDVYARFVVQTYGLDHLPDRSDP